MIAVRHLADPTAADVEGLTAVLLDCVSGGASVGFMNPLDPDHARRFWQRVAQECRTGSRHLLVAEDEHGIVGTVQLVLALPDNQPHRADLAKMLVHRRGRRRGVGESLIRAAEQAARRQGRSLLVLDTVTDSDAARLYARLGWVRVGDVPQFALWPDGGYCSTTFFYRRLD